MFLQFYGLREQPFGVTPDPRFLYMGPTQQEAFASLLYGLETGRGFMALIAEPGMGKTTMILRIMEKLRDPTLTAFLFQTHGDSREFLKNLLLDLDVQPKGKDLSDLQAQLRDVLLQGSQSGKRLVVVIDEAQHLDDAVLEMIRMLSNFETPQAKLLQIILAGQPALADKLAQPHLSQLRQRISIIARFSPLRGGEIENYIHHRLRVAGYQWGRLFTPEALQLIERYSKGIPRIINNLCFHALSLGYVKDQKKIDVATLREVVADLNLESLGERREEAVGQPPAPDGASVVQASAGARSQVQPSEFRLDLKPRLDLGPQPAKTGSVLDRVDFSGFAPERRKGSGVQKSARPTGRANSLRKVEVLVVFAIAAISVCAWRARWLKPSVDFLEQAIWGFVGRPEGMGNLPTVRQPAEAAPVSRNGSYLQNELRDNVGNNKLQSTVESPAEAHGVGSSLPSPDVAPSTPWRARLAKKTDTVVPGSRWAKARRPVSYGRSDSVDDLGVRGPRGQLIVQSSAGGARITLNGRSESKWVTPHRFSLVPGSYTVSVWKNGYVNWTRRVQVNEGKDNWLLAELSDNGEGVLTVETEPSGMQVYIDGRPYGASRVVTVLGAGWHTCEVIPQPGMKPVVGKFHLDPGEALTKRIRVRTVTASSGSQAQAPQTGALSRDVTLVPKGERLE